MLELLNCPFCGAEGHVIALANNSNSLVVVKYRVQCDNQECDICPETNWHYNREDAIGSWNRRV